MEPDDVTGRSGEVGEYQGIRFIEQPRRAGRAAAAMEEMRQWVMRHEGPRAVRYDMGRHDEMVMMGAWNEDETRAPSETKGATLDAHSEVAGEVTGSVVRGERTRIGYSDPHGTAHRSRVRSRHRRPHRVVGRVAGLPGL